jgi:hypothetical protein
VSRAIVESSFTTIGGAPYWTAGGTWATVSDANASGGSYLSSSSVGATQTLTIPISSGITGILLLCSRVARTGVATVTVDGVVQADTWVQDNFTTAAATTGQTYANGLTQPIAWQRTAYRPIYFANPALAHTVVITVVTGPVTVDAVETYIAVATATAGRITTMGHSIPAGSGVTTAQRFPALLAAMLGGTDDNHCFGGSGLLYDTGATLVDAIGWQQAEGGVGSVNGNMTGCLVTSPGTGYLAIPTVTYSAPQDPRGVTTTGSCTLSGTTIQFMTITNAGRGYTSGPTVTFTPTSGGSGAAAGPGTFTNLDVYSLGAHWWGRTPEYAILSHGLNDANVFAAGDPGGGLGYVRQLFTQRAREQFWRMNLNSPATFILALGITYTSGASTPTGLALHIQWSNLIAAAANDPTVTNALYVDMLPVLLNAGGTATAISQDGTHPTVLGHQILATALMPALQRVRARPSSRGGLV